MFLKLTTCDAHANETGSIFLNIHHIQSIETLNQNEAAPITKITMDPNVRGLRGAKDPVPTYHPEHTVKESTDYLTFILNKYLVG